MNTFAVSSCKLPPSQKQKKQKTKNTFWGHFQFSEGYTYLRSSIVNPFLCSFLGVNQLYTTGSLRYMVSPAISSS